MSKNKWSSSNTGMWSDLVEIASLLLIAVVIIAIFFHVIGLMFAAIGDPILLLLDEPCGFYKSGAVGFGTVVLWAMVFGGIKLSFNCNCKDK